jgi:tRNA(Phe) wybutosine-synthesizing methylase Tyw3
LNKQHNIAVLNHKALLAPQSSCSGEISIWDAFESCLRSMQ